MSLPHKMNIFNSINLIKLTPDRIINFAFFFIRFEFLLTMTTGVRFLTIISILVLINDGNAAESSTAQQLLGLGWDALKGFGEIITKALLHLALWGIFWFILGIVSGVFLWRVLRDRGWMDVPWGWYKYVCWMWPVLIVATLSLGLGSTLATWGSGRAFNFSLRTSIYRFFGFSCRFSSRT